MIAESEAKTSVSVLRQLMRVRLVPVGAAILVLLVLVALFVPLLAPYDPLEQNYGAVLKPPSAQHLLGTDNLGRDVLSRIMYGARVSIQVGFISVGISAVVGCVLGLVGAYFGGVVDAAVMRICDAMMSFPSLILSLSITSVLGPGLVNCMMAIGIVGIPRYARLIRGQVLSVREREFVVATRTLGASPTRIMFRHIFPNVLSPIIVQSSISMASAIRTEANLSFLGMGIRPPEPSWGSMLRSAYTYLEVAPWFAIFPGIAIFVVIMALNWLGDGVRTVLDPKLSERKKS